MEIAESYRYQTGMRRLLDFLSVNDLPLSLATRLYRRYGGDALEQIRANPYLLVDELYGVDFAVMDRDRPVHGGWRGTAAAGWRPPSSSS